MTTPYTAPASLIKDLLNDVYKTSNIANSYGHDDLDHEFVNQIMDEAAKFAENELHPLWEIGDKQGCKVKDTVVTTPDGWKKAYRHYVDNGWNSLVFDPNYGGQGLPWLMGLSVQEMFHGANTSFSLACLLNKGAIELLQHHGSDAQKSIYLEKMISGEWTATMNLTEPQAGSDLAAVKTKAEKDASGAFYRIKGQKIFITYGEHDMTDNIIHMVLARLPGAPDGIKGISLFIVPKFLVNNDGSLGDRNDLGCIALEHKLGIHASPTATMSFGDNDGAIGYLIGKEGEGIRYMFTMMNNARLGVGYQSLGIAEAAKQKGENYAHERIQGKIMGQKTDNKLPIAHHPDVDRMIKQNRAYVSAMRALNYTAAFAIDHSHIATKNNDSKALTKAKTMVEFLIPMAKSWSSDLACHVSSVALQIFGGMGFVEETGAAQHYRDARITPIYEGTNGIQANDLLGRKIARDGGKSLDDFVGILCSYWKTSKPSIKDKAMVEELEDMLDRFENNNESMLALLKKNPLRAFHYATEYLEFTSHVSAAIFLTHQVASVKHAETKKHLLADLNYFVMEIIPNLDGFDRKIARD